MTVKKMLPLSLALVCVIVIISIGSVWVFNELSRKNAVDDPSLLAVSSVDNVEGNRVTAAEIKELTVPMDSIITNLKEHNKAVKASFAFEVNSKKGKAEFENYDARIRNVINKTLADLSSEDLAGSVGQDNLTSLLMNKINAFLSEGRVRQINITELIIQ